MLSSIISNCRSISSQYNHPSELSEMNTKYVKAYRNGADADPQILEIPQTLDALKKEASISLITKVERVFLADGTEVKEASYLRDKDIIYLSSGEDFIQLPKENTQPKVVARCSDWVTLNVGGKYFSTSKSTLTSKEPHSMLARMFAENADGYLFTPSNVDANGAYLIDRSPTYFEPILNYLRNGQLIYDRGVNPEGIVEEARFFGIDSIIPPLEQKILEQAQSRDSLPLTRRDVVDALIRTPCTAELRFQGVNLAGADLSKLDLRFINFKYANLQGCKLTGANLSWCCLERADLSRADLNGAQLLGVKSLCANMEGTSLRSCNFKDPAGSRANMEGVNLKGAVLEGSDMGGVNLRVATLKHANLQNCDLRAAVLAGADLEFCDLSGSDLHEANLRGANLKDAAFKLMLTPIHMSQTVR